jgi:hypothetical protein
MEDMGKKYERVCVGAVLVRNQDRHRDDPPLVLHLYAVTSWTGVPRNLSPREHSEISWFAVEDACRLVLAHPTYRKILRTAASVATGTEGEKPA